MQGDIKVICGKFCKPRSYIWVSWLLPMLKIFSFFFVGVQSLLANPLGLTQLSPLMALHNEIIILKKNWRRIKKKVGSERQNVTKQESGIEQLLNRQIVRRICYFCNFCLLLCHFMVCGFVKFATFGIFVILPSAHFDLAGNIRSLRILLYLRLI